MRKRVSVRADGSGTAGDGVPKKDAAAKQRGLKPQQCRALMRRRLTAEFPAIVEGFVEQAKQGSCPHVKLASELLANPVAKARRRKSGVQRMLEELSGVRSGPSRRVRGDDGQFVAKG